MTKKLEKEFDLPPMEEVIEKAKEKANEQKTISEAEDKKIESGQEEAVSYTHLTLPTKA